MNLRTIALTTTALVAIASAVNPAQAAGQYMGKVNLGLGLAFEDWGNDGGEDSNDVVDLEYTTLHGSASVNVPVNERINAQFDIFGAESLDEGWDCGGEGSVCGSFYGGFGAGAHLNYRDEDGALGVFGTVGRAAVGVTGSWDFVVYAAGLEGQYFCNQWTLSAQAGYLDSDESGYGLVVNAGFIRVGADYYPSPRLKLSGRVGYLDGDTSGSRLTSTFASDVSEWNWSFAVEYLIGRSVPVTAYLQYLGQNSEAYSPNEFEADRHEVRAGFRFLFGGNPAGDLIEADREGAGMESPDIITWPRFDF